MRTPLKTRRDEGGPPGGRRPIKTIDSAHWYSPQEVEEGGDKTAFG